MTKKSPEQKQQPSKLGKKAGDIFSPPTPQKQALAAPVIEGVKEQSELQAQQLPDPSPAHQKSARGRPQQHQEEWSKTTVVLLDRQIHWLDKLALDIRQKTKAAISRAEIIRALIAAVEKSNLDISSCTSESEITETIASKLLDG